MLDTTPRAGGLTAEQERWCQGWEADDERRRVMGLRCEWASATAMRRLYRLGWTCACRMTRREAGRLERELRAKEGMA